MKTFTPSDIGTLLFRRQFVLGPRLLKRCCAWQKAQIGDSLFVQAHPDLELTQVKHREAQLTLLGYLLDPDNPVLGNHEILEQLLFRMKTPDDLFQATYRLGGRWILILDDPCETILFHDPGGLRQVFYTDSNSLERWCASQPGIIAEELGLGVDKKAENEFLNSVYFQHTKEYWWPGNSAPFKDLKHLSPNHYLDLGQGICHRYWPKEKLRDISLEEGVKQSSDILTGLIESAFNRFKLAFALTAGWDTRVLLAASKEFRRGIVYYTCIYYDLTEDSPDLKIPGRLLSKLGLKHHIIHCPSQMQNDFREIYHRNVVTAHDAWAHIAQGLYYHYPQNRVCVKGVISSEIVRFALRGYYHYALANRENVSVESLAGLANMEANPFAIAHFTTWLSEARGIAERHNINIVELFGWEQITGNWQAMNELEWDIVHETFVPFNCRKLLTTLLGVDAKFRKPLEYELYRRIVSRLDRAVLSESINPTGMKDKVKRGLERLLIETRNYERARKWYAKVRKKWTTVGGVGRQR